MRFVLLLLTYSLVYSGGAAQSSTAEKKSDTTVRINGKIILANAGFAPVPAFSFNSPIAMGFLTIKKRRFSYDPDFSIGLNGQPWMYNNWFRFLFVDRQKLTLSTGVNPSLFFRAQRTITGEQFFHALRNLTFEMAADHKFSDVISLRMTYMFIHAFDNGALSGNFIDISSSLLLISIPKVVAVNLKQEIFYFNFTGTVDGVFTSASVSLVHHSVPLSLYGQFVLPIWSAFPVKSFQWNAGLAYTF
jgi:hypothetical protein